MAKTRKCGKQQTFPHFLGLAIQLYLQQD